MSKARTSSCARFRSGRDGVLGLCWQSLRLGRSLRQRRPLSGARISKSDASDYPGLWGKKGQRQSAFSGAACAGQRVPGVGSAALWGACWRRRLELRPGMGRGSGVVLHLHWWGMPGSVVGWRKRLVPHRRLGGREDLCRARLGVGAAHAVAAAGRRQRRGRLPWLHTRRRRRLVLAMKRPVFCFS